ncbi:unnamed protein product [Closterium sp. NIES-54]
MEQLIRATCDDPSTWEQQLPLIEFAYNNSTSATTQQSPFYLNYGQNPTVPMTLNPDNLHRCTRTAPPSRPSASSVAAMVKDVRAPGFREKWRQDVPVLYDWFFNHHLMWPSLSCRWGPVRAEHGAYSEQYVYISEQTDGTAPNTLLLANVAVSGEEGGRASGREGEGRVLLLDQHNTFTDTNSAACCHHSLHPLSPPCAQDDSSELAAPVLHCRETFTGHRATVEDVQFSPSDARLFCSVGDDYCLLLWDTRHGTTPVNKVERAHNADLHCVDWSRLDDNYVLTGSADHSVRLFDRRKLPTAGHCTPVHTFKHHLDAVTCVQWHPSARGVFGSAGDDGLIQVTDASHIMGAAGDKAGGGGAQGRQMNMFQHLGHREKVCEFHWNPHRPWTVVSTSIDSGRIGGGTLQVWRMHDLFHLPEEAAQKKLEGMIGSSPSKT